MTFPLWTVRVALAAMLMTSTPGCREETSGVSVHGHVSYRQQPIENGTLTFFPAVGRPIHASLASGGKYTVDLEPGDYRVVVNISAELPEGWKEGDPVPPPKILLPAEYTTRAASTLQVTVVEGHPDPIDFNLE